MDKIRIVGGRPLEGRIPIAGAKNAALPLMAAALLSPETLTLRNVPTLADIDTLSHLLGQHGVDILVRGANGQGGRGRVVELTAARITDSTAPYDIVRKMRASVLVLGPLLARVGQARVSLPGGCAIGTRPVDLHLMGLQRLGAEIEIADGYIAAEAPRGLSGAVIRFPKVSVGATENLLMAATLADGQTVLENAAREPEIGDLANCLNAMGARIRGIGGDTLTVEGVARLGAADYTVLPDRIESATYAMAAGIAGGRLFLDGGRFELMEATAGALADAGVEVTPVDGGIQVCRDGNRVRATDVTTQPFPGFPTDAQAQIMAMLSAADGASVIEESIFENRFMHVQELNRMGADIRVRGSSAVIRGVPELSGAPVMATDLRASVSLVLAGLAARGETVVHRVYHLDRGYERVEEKLAACGAEIERLSD